MDNFGPIYLSTPTPVHPVPTSQQAVIDRLNGYVCMQGQLLSQYRGHVLKAADLHLMDTALLEPGGVHPLQAGHDWIFSQLSPILLGS